MAENWVVYMDSWEFGSECFDGYANLEEAAAAYRRLQASAAEHTARDGVERTLYLVNEPNAKPEEEHPPCYPCVACGHAETKPDLCQYVLQIYSTNVASDGTLHADSESLEELSLASLDDLSVQHLTAQLTDYLACTKCGARVAPAPDTIQWN
jgi:hypothetical protein